MKSQFVVLAAVSATALAALASESVGSLPEPWIVAGESPQLYHAGIDYRDTVSGKGAKFIRSKNGDEKSWATVMQTVAATRYRGQRVRFQARIKAQNVSLWTGLWMRVDTPSKGGVSFYNSEDKPIKGSHDWQLRSVVLDVPADASSINFGLLDKGSGQVWMDDIKFDIVGKDVPVDALQGKWPETPTL